METRLRLSIAPQPDDTTCGPTCLQAVYRYYGDNLDLGRVITEVTPLETGGTLAVFLACHALQRGYRATIYTYNLQLFDPTWFQDKQRDIPRLLEAQAAVKDDLRMRISSDAYLEFFRLGGKIRFEDLRPSLIRKYLVKERPILTGLSATYLYHCEREREDNEYDSIAGSPTGHFVILCGYDRKSRQVHVADPQSENPMTGTQYYTVGIERVIGAILLGIVTYDANLLIIEPTGGGGR